MRAGQAIGSKLDRLLRLFRDNRAGIEVVLLGVKSGRGQELFGLAVVEVRREFAHPSYESTRGQAVQMASPLPFVIAPYGRNIIAISP
jgi:hypothetical protein